MDSSQCVYLTLLNRICLLMLIYQRNLSSKCTTMIKKLNTFAIGVHTKNIENTSLSNKLIVSEIMNHMDTRQCLAMIVIKHTLSPRMMLQHDGVSCIMHLLKAAEQPSLKAWILAPEQPNPHTATRTQRCINNLPHQVSGKYRSQQL